MKSEPGLPQPIDVDTAGPTHSLRPLLREALETVLLALLAFCILRLGFQNYKVQGPSMEPTLRPGQFLLVWKLAYASHPVERGDIVVFRSATRPTQAYIKRVVGLPGETVESSNGEVCIDGVPLDEPYSATPAYRSWGPITAPDDCLVVLGDNRANSNDSRSWGPLPLSNLVGKAWFCYWPPADWGRLQ